MSKLSFRYTSVREVITVMTELGIRLKTLRLQYNLTQEDLAQKLGVSKSVISAYENGFRRPSFEALIKLAYTFQVSTDYLLGIEQKSMLDLSGLTPEQKTAIKKLVDTMRMPIHLYTE